MRERGRRRGRPTSPRDSAAGQGGAPSDLVSASEYLNAAERRSVWRAAAHRIVHVAQHEQILIGARLAERIEAGQAQLGTCPPPAVRAAAPPRKNRGADLRLGANATARRFHGDPLDAPDPVSRGRLGMYLGGRVRRGLPEAWQATELAVH